MAKLGWRIVPLIVLLLSAAQARAHPEGHGPITSEKAVQIARTVTADLAESDGGLGFGKLAPSWTQLPSEASKVHLKEHDYFIVSIRNEAEKRTLFVLLSTSGEVYDANFTGNFPALKKDAASKKSD